MKTTLSLESQHDSAGPRGSQNQIFSVCLGTDFRCLFRTLFFCLFLIFNDFRDPSGLRLATLLGAKESIQGALSPTCPQEGPWEGFGLNFELIWDLFMCIFYIIC